jgi:hypothetical protein
MTFHKLCAERGQPGAKRGQQLLSYQWSTYHTAPEAFRVDRVDVPYAPI